MSNVMLERMMRERAKAVADPDAPVRLKEDRTAIPSETVEEVPQDAIDGDVPEKAPETPQEAGTGDEGGIAPDAPEGGDAGGYVPHELPDSIARIVEAPEGEDLDVSVEMTPGGTERSRSTAARPREKVEIPRSRPKATRKRETVYLRDVPKALVTEAKRLFPHAKNQTDAVAAFMAYKTGIVDDLTEEQFKQLKGYHEEDPVEALQRKVEGMEQNMRVMTAFMQEMEFAMGFLIYDRLGFRRDSADSPLSVNMTEDGVYDMVKRMQDSSRIFRERKRVKDGRPRR